MWCENIDAKDYACFLSQILSHVSVQIVQKGYRRKRVFKSIQGTVHFVD